MITFVPNATVSVLDTAVVENADGDAVDNYVVASTGTPAVWCQRNQRTYDPVSGRTTIIRGFEVRLRPGTAVTEQQRLRNDRTGELGAVRRVDRQATLGVAGDVVCWVAAVEH